MINNKPPVKVSTMINPNNTSEIRSTGFNTASFFITALEKVSPFIYSVDLIIKINWLQSSIIEQIKSGNKKHPQNSQQGAKQTNRSSCESKILLFNKTRVEYNRIRRTWGEQ